MNGKTGGAGIRSHIRSRLGAGAGAGAASAAAASAALAALLVCGLTGCTGQSTPPPTTSPTASSTVSPTATATPTRTATPTPTPTTPAATTSPTGTSAPDDPAATARAGVVLACQTWQTSLSQDASTYPATQANALAMAQSAAAGDAQWQPVASTMQTLVSLNGDTSSAGIAKGQQAFTDLGNECQQVGVVVNGG